MEKLLISKDGTLFFWCPGCDEYHGVWVENPNPLTGGQWNWNKSTVSPTFTPSILLRDPVCHCIVTDGKIRYLDDCHHRLAGQTVCMADIK